MFRQNQKRVLAQIVHLSMSLFLISFLFGVSDCCGKDLNKIHDGGDTKKIENAPLDGLSLTIEVRQVDSPSDKGAEQPLHVGKPVYLLITLTNVTHDTLHIFQRTPDVDFDILVWDSAEKLVAKTLYGKKYAGQKNAPFMEFSHPSRTILPGKSLNYKLDLSRQYDLSLVGKYTVQALRDIRQMRGTGTPQLKSNVVAFELKELFANKVQHSTELFCIKQEQNPIRTKGVSLILQQWKPTIIDGPFFTLAFAGPMFQRPISIEVGEKVERDGFFFADVK